MVATEPNNTPITSEMNIMKLHLPILSFNDIIPLKVNIIQTSSTMNFMSVMF